MEEQKSKFVGKKFAKAFTRNFAQSVLDQFNELGNNEIRAIIKLASDFSQTNCAWAEYWLKDIIINFGKDALRDRKLLRKVKK